MNTGLLTWCQSFGIHVVFSDTAMMSERAPFTSSMLLVPMPYPLPTRLICSVLLLNFANCNWLVTL